MPVMNKTNPMLSHVDAWENWRYLNGAADNTIYAHATYVRAFINDMPHTINHPSKISAEIIQHYVNKSDGKSDNTKEFTLAAITVFLEYLMGKGHIMVNPAKIVKVNKRKLSHAQRRPRPRHPITIKEFQEIMRKAPYFIRQATAIGWYTGLRLGDVCNLEWACLTDTHITVYTLKRDKYVELPLDHKFIGGGVLRIILNEIEKSHDQYMFPVERTMINDPKNRATISGRISKFYKRVGVNKSFHCLRHTFVTRLASEGVDLKDIGKLVGHSNVSTTEGYSHVI